MAAASGARLMEETRLVGLLRDGQRVVGATLRGEHGQRGERGTAAVRADWTVAADGARSLTARLLGVERPVRFPRRLGLVAHYSGAEGLIDSGEMHVGRDAYIGLAPTPGGELNVGMALPMTHGHASNRWEAAIEAIPAVARRLAGARRLTPIRGAAPIGHRVSSVAGDGWLLIGDAAGFIDPFTGEGNLSRTALGARGRRCAGLGGPGA